MAPSNYLSKTAIVFFMLLFTFNTNAQINSFNNSEKNIFQCQDSITVDSTTNTITLYGYAEFKTDIIEINWGDKIVFDKRINEILVSGSYDVKIDGVVRISNESDTKNLRYKLGDHIAYVE